MRIIGGTYGGRVIKVPKGLPVRPTTDRTKEALFNILSHQILWEESSVLDLFAGTGNISLECLSRGAKELTAVDKHRRCVASIEKSKASLGIKKGQIICMDVFKFLRQCDSSFDFIFMDPPYAMPKQEDLVSLIYERNILADEGLLVLEHSNTRSFTGIPGFDLVRKYGSSHLSFFR